MSEDKREHRRIPIEMWVEEVRGSDRYFQRSGNLSTGGLYLDNTIPHARGTVVQLQFVLPGDTEPVKVRGEIVGLPEGNRLGMHVKFLGLDEDEALARKLREFVERHAGAGTS